MTTLILIYFLLNTILAVNEHLTASERMKKYYEVAGNSFFLMVFFGLPITILRIGIKLKSYIYILLNQEIEDEKISD